MLVRGFTLENYYKIKTDRITNRRKNKKLSEPSLNIVAFSFILSPEFDNIYSLYYFPFFFVIPPKDAFLNISKPYGLVLFA